MKLIRFGFGVLLASLLGVQVHWLGTVHLLLLEGVIFIFLVLLLLVELLLQLLLLGCVGETHSLTRIIVSNIVIVLIAILNLLQIIQFILLQLLLLHLLLQLCFFCQMEFATYSVIFAHDVVLGLQAEVHLLHISYRNLSFLHSLAYC